MYITYTHPIRANFVHVLWTLRAHCVREHNWLKRTRNKRKFLTTRIISINQKKYLNAVVVWSGEHVIVEKEHGFEFELGISLEQINDTFTPEMQECMEFGFERLSFLWFREFT